MSTIHTGDLWVEGFEGMGTILEFYMDETPGNHSYARVTGLAERTAKGRWAYEEELHGQVVTIQATGADKPIYSGMIQKVSAGEENGLHRVCLELASGTIRMDLVKKDHSYQDIGMSYGALIGQVADQAGGGAIWPSELDSVPLGVPRIAVL